MAYNYTLLYILATLLSVTFVNAVNISNVNQNIPGIVSTKYIGVRKGGDVFGDYVTPIDHCVTQRYNTSFRSQIFKCEPLNERQCQRDCAYYVEGEECPCRQVVKYIYGQPNCRGPIVFTDEFDEGSIWEYPFNCYEPEEIECELDANGTVKVDDDGNALCYLVSGIDPNDYAPSLVELRVTHAEMMQDEVIETVYENGTAPYNRTVYEDVCISQDLPFYKSYAMVTELCVFGGFENDPDCTPADHAAGICHQHRPYWHIAHCDSDTFSVRKFLDVNCSDGEEVIQGHWPFMRNDGCGPSQILGEWWYTEVVNCTHPVAGLQAAAFRHFDHHFIVMMGIAIIAVFKLV